MKEGLDSAEARLNAMDGIVKHMDVLFGARKHYLNLLSAAAPNIARRIPAIIPLFTADKKDYNPTPNEGPIVRYLYSFLFYLAMPFILLRLLWRGRRLPEYLRRVSERFGFCPYQLKNTLWIHSVSVGETIAAIPLIKALKSAYPQMPILITNMTPTGAARVKAAFGDSVLQAYIPYDLPGSVARFLNRIQPKIAVIMETELWPNLFAQCKQRNIPIVITNARLSAQSARGYQAIRPLTKQMLSAVTLLASQGVLDAERFVKLGLSPDRVTVTGNLKFDLDIPSSLMEQGKTLRQQLGADRAIWIAASTHGGEEEIMLAAHRLLLQQDPHALLVLVPRHPDRFNSVANYIEQQGFKFQRRSQGSAVAPETSVYLADSMGELLLLYAASDIALVGGSFISVGGHNLLEPAALAKPVLSGPQLFNFAEISQKLLDAHALVIVNNTAELAEAIQKIMQDKSYCQQLGDNARGVVEENRGSLQKQLQLIQSVL